MKLKYDSAYVISHGFPLGFASLVWLLEQEHKKLKKYFAMNNNENLKWERAAQELGKVAIFIKGCNNKKMKDTLNQMYDLGKSMYPTSIEIMV